MSSHGVRRIGRLHGAGGFKALDTRTWEAATAGAGEEIGELGDCRCNDL